MKSTINTAAKVVQELNQTNESSDTKKKAYNIQKTITRALKEKKRN
jgi:hypothetical protein